jgi:hypothetical protein
MWFCLKLGADRGCAHIRLMKQHNLPVVIQGLEITSITGTSANWDISADALPDPICPGCGTRSVSRHSRYERRLRDLPIQGVPVWLKVQVARWRCRNAHCSRTIFVQRLPDIASVGARRTRRTAEIVTLFGHAAGGRPGERLMRRLGMPVSDDTLLRHVKSAARDARPAESLRVVGVDDWAWRKGQRYGTILVDLERRVVADVLADRSSAAVGAWLSKHPSVRIVTRDRHGLYAEGARQGARQARQVADRFHLLQNLREAVEKQLSRLGRPLRGAAPLMDIRSPTFVSCAPRARPEVAEHRHLVSSAKREVQEATFEQVHFLYQAGRTAADIVRELGLSRKRVDKWIRLPALPERNAMTPTPYTPAFFHEHLSRRWASGCTDGRKLFGEIKELGYKGCYSYLARHLSKWRHGGAPAPQARPLSRELSNMPIDPVTGRCISPLTAAALCIKPRPLLTAAQTRKVDILKGSSSDFAAMRHLAMRFRGLLRGGPGQN